MKSVTLMLLAFASIARSESYCSLIVQVVDKSDREFEATITVRESDGVVHVKENEPGGARFCLLGLLPVDVIVGDENCNQATVRNVPINYRKTVTTKIVYDHADCLYDPPPAPVPTCRFLLRVYDQETQPLPKATVRIRSPYSADLTTDEGGRALILARRGTGLNATVSAAGYREQKVSFDCPRARSDERKIQMKKITKQ